MTYAEGKKYEGKWKDDMAFGAGVFTGCGIVYDGTWTNGKVLTHFLFLLFLYIYLFIFNYRCMVKVHFNIQCIHTAAFLRKERERALERVNGKTARSMRAIGETTNVLEWESTLVSHLCISFIIYCNHLLF